MKQLYLTILLFLIAIPVSAEKLVKGHVLDEQEEPIIGANIYWERHSTRDDLRCRRLFRTERKWKREEFGRQLYRVYGVGSPGRGDKQAFACRVGWRSRFAGSRDQRA